MLKMSGSRLTNHGFESFKGNVYVDTVHFLSHKHPKVGVDIGLQHTVCYTSNYCRHLIRLSLNVIVRYYILHGLK